MVVGQRGFTVYISFLRSLVWHDKILVRIPEPATRQIGAQLIQLSLLSGKHQSGVGNRLSIIKESLQFFKVRFPFNLSEVTQCVMKWDVVGSKAKLV